MGYIQKLPFILAASMTVIIGILSYSNDVPGQEIYLRMLVSLIVFFVIGIYIRQCFNSLYENVQEKIKEQSLEAQENNTSTIDYRIDDKLDPSSFEEEFTPLKVSQVIKTKMKDGI